MADQLQYKCPNCGGAVTFDTASQKMKCPYCDAEFEPQALISLDSELRDMAPDAMEWQNSGAEWAEGETNGLSVYSCGSCGGEIVADENTGATRCPFCDSPVVLTGRFAGDLRPEIVIPFKLDKAQAVEALKRHLKGKKFLPKVFKDENHIDEVKGVYVPFWLFSTDVDADIRYKAAKIRTWSDSNYKYTQTSYFSVVRAGRIGFSSVPADGSQKIDDTLMESIEPFDLRGAVAFNTTYLAGYMADRYDVTAEDVMPRANERIRNSTAQEFASTVTGYDSVTPEHASLRSVNGAVKYALYPVWLLNTTWNERKFIFAMNGQTGAFVGDLPCDNGIAARTGILSAAISGGAVFALLSAFWYLL